MGGGSRRTGSHGCGNLNFPLIHRLYLWDEADFDVVDAVAWYEGQRSGLGVEVLMELDTVMQRIVQGPIQFPPWP